MICAEIVVEFESSDVVQGACAHGGDGFTFSYPEVAPLGQIAFVPGVYTLAVSSLWGQAEVIHFTVK